MARGHPVDIPFSCACGGLAGHLRGVSPRSGTHCVCHCPDCRAFQVVLGQDDPGYETGVDIFQTLPSAVDIERGRQHLALLRLSPKGLFRWYASCCDTPLAATFTSRAVPFTGWLSDTLSDTAPLGPVRVQGFIRKNGGPGLTHQGIMSAVVGMFGRVGSAYLNGTARQTPFFDVDTGAPVVTPQVLPRDRRDAAYAALRP